MAEGGEVPTSDTYMHEPIRGDGVDVHTLRRELLARSPTAKICIGDKVVDCILDTGAETSLLTSKFYHQHLERVEEKLGDIGTFINLRGANDLEIPVKGYLRTQIRIFGQELTASFLVTNCASPGDSNPRREKYPILLGCNVLRMIAHHQGCVANVQPGSDWDLALRWVRSVEGRCEDHADYADKYCHAYDVRMQESVSIPPESAKIVSCEVDRNMTLGGPDSGPLLLHVIPLYTCDEGEQVTGICDGEQRSCYVLEGVHHSDSTSIMLAIFNTGFGSVLIPRDVKVATATLVEATEEVVVDSSCDEITVSVQNVVSIETDCAEVSVESPKQKSEEVPQGETFDKPREPFVFPDGEEFLLPPGLSLKNLSDSDAVEAARLVQRHNDAFSADPLDLGYCSLIPHEIKLTDDRPVNLPYRRVMPCQITEVKQMLQDLLNRNIIRRSASSYASPVVLVKKKNGQLRLCIDYRCLNAKTQKDAFPLPRIEETLEALGGSQYFSSLDLTHGYFQVSLHPNSIAKTAFRVPWGLYEFLRLPQGLTNSPSTFQRVMELIFGDLNLSEVILYLDDVLVFSETFDEHLVRLDKVFSRITENGLKLKGSKCKLFQTSISHLGHVVSDTGIAVDPEKVARVRDWPIPASPSQLRSFLGLASYYRRYVKGFSAIAAPLHKLSVKSPEQAGKSAGPFEWSAEANEAFETLKRALCEAPVLAFPRFDRDFVLEIDASMKGLGACLSQYDEGGNLHPVAYASRGLRGAERNYSDFSSFKLELLALKWAVSEKFKEYLLGRKTVVWTDNNPVAHIQTAKLGATEQRWVAQLAPFELEIKYRSGRTNKCADALSRNPPEIVEAAELFHTVTRSSPLPIQLQVVKRDGCRSVDTGDLPGVTPSVLPSLSFSDLTSLQKKDDALGKVWLLWEKRWKPGQEGVDLFSTEVKGWIKEWPHLTEHNGVLYRVLNEPGLGRIDQLLVPKSLRSALVEAAHDQWGHQGVGRTLSFLKRRCFWPGVNAYVREHVRNCYHCTITKTPTPTVRAPMQHLLSFRPLERLAIDFLKLDRGRGNIEDVLVMTDSFTKFAVAVPCRDQKAPTVARALRDHWFARYGVPMQLHSDRGRNFEGNIIQELCKLYGVRKTRTTPYHAQGNAQTERFNKTLCGLIKSLDRKNRSQWPDLLPHLVFIYNSTPHSVTGFTPYTLMFGREPTVPLDQLINHTHSNWDESVVDRQAKLIQEAHRLAKQRLLKAAQASKRRYDKRVHTSPLPVGSRVLLKECAFTDRHKLANTYGELQYVVVKRNEEGSLYAVRPFDGGAQRWVNRKMLVLDPRGESVEFSSGVPSFNLPFFEGNGMKKAESDDSSDEDNWAVVPSSDCKTESLQPFAGTPVVKDTPTRVNTSGLPTHGTPMKTGASSPSTPAHDSPPASDTVLRRSERLRQKRSGCWPNAIT